MRITKEQLKQIIKEEMAIVLLEGLEELEKKPAAQLLKRELGVDDQDGWIDENDWYNLGKSGLREEILDEVDESDVGWYKALIVSFFYTHQEALENGLDIPDKILEKSDEYLENWNLDNWIG